MSADAPLLRIDDLHVHFRVKRGPLFRKKEIVISGARGRELLQVGKAATLADSIFTTYVVPFEIVSILLLAALVGAVVMARRD